VSAVARLAAFGAVLAAVFAVASVAGAALDAGSGIEEEPSHEEDGMEATMSEDHAGGGSHEEAAGALPPGLAVAQDGYRLVIEGTELHPGEAGTLSFRIVDAEDETVTDFDTEHERRMHLIVARSDLSGFQHLHPEQLPNGSWVTDLAVGDAGDYRVYADFAVADESLTLASDVFVPGEFEARPLPAERPLADAGDGYEVESAEGDDGALRFEISRDGKPVREVQPYLGADGHLVVLRQGDGAFLHAHPVGEAGGSGPVEFVVEYPSAGAYRLYLQFKHDGKVRTAEFTRHIGKTAPAAHEEGHGHG